MQAGFCLNLIPYDNTFLKLEVPQLGCWPHR